MFQKLGVPAFLREARTMGLKPRSPILEVLIFFLIMSVAPFAQSALLSPFLFVAMLFDPHYYETITSDKSLAVEEIIAYTETLMQKPLVVIGSLFATAATILIVFLYCRLIEKRSFSSMGLRRNGLRSIPAGALWAIVLLAAALGFSALFGAVSFGGATIDKRSLWLPVILLGFLVQGFSEEILLRGYLMTSLARSMPLGLTVIISAAAFAAMHIGNPGFGALAFLNIFLFGVFMSLYMIRTGNLWGAGILHAVWNFAVGCIVGLPVSGLTMPASLLSLTASEEMAVIGGGAFGPEGGLAVTFVLTLGIAILGMMKTKTDTAAQEPQS